VAQPNQTIFVLGAGFTKAFAPKAPLLVDDYPELIEIEKEFSSSPEIQDLFQLVALERKRNEGKIDFERFLTRLDSGMPYDQTRGRNELFRVVLSRVKVLFAKRLSELRATTIHTAELGSFASYCLQHNASCITFNYDDVLDKVLYEHGKNRHPFWTPDAGYGFFCRPRQLLIHNMPVFMDKPGILLLKLHGSVNWRIQLGTQSPFRIDSFYHAADWFEPYTTVAPVAIEYAEKHLEPTPFIVPPVLSKTALLAEPILRYVWNLACETLESAREIVFVGYSLPLTDLAASTLFSEAISRSSPPDIRVMIYHAKEEERQRILNSYKKLFGEKVDFIVGDARESLLKYISEHSTS